MAKEMKMANQSSVEQVFLNSFFSIFWVWLWTESEDASCWSQRYGIFNTEGFLGEHHQHEGCEGIAEITVYAIDERAMEDKRKRRLQCWNGKEIEV